MSYVQVRTTWTLTGTGAGGNVASGTGLAFNTDTKQIEPWAEARNLAILDPKPPDVNLPVGALLWFECDASFTQTSWYYDGGTATHTTTAANSTWCGWSPPLTCELGAATVAQQATATGARLTASYPGTANGTVYYSLDGGAEQTSPSFPQVAPGQHQVKVRDGGLAGCERVVSVTVAAPAAQPTPPAAPTGAAQGVDFVSQPLFYTLHDQAVGALVELALWAERAHYQGDFYSVLTLRKRADTQGRVSFRLDQLLEALLLPFVPPAGVEAVNQVTQVCATNLVNYYVRTTSTAPAAGALPDYQVSPLRTALRGGLPAEWQAVDYFARRSSDEFDYPPFLSWQPYGAGAYAGGLAKPVVAGQPEWLCWLCPPELAGAQLRVRRAYQMSATGTPSVDYEPLMRPAGGWACRLLAIPLKDGRAGFAQLSVRVETLSGQQVSAEALFRFVGRSERTRFLLFTNSLGGLDTLRCEGKLEVTLEATADAVELPPVAAVTQAPVPDQRGFAVTAGRKLKLGSGWLTPAELLWAQELVLTRELWQLAGTQLRALAWPKRTLAPYADEPGLRGLLLDNLGYAYQPTAYAPVTYS